MPDPYGFIQNQKRGDVGVFAGPAGWLPSSLGLTFPAVFRSQGADPTAATQSAVAGITNSPALAQFIEGSSTNPATSDTTATVMISRRSAMTVLGDNNAALWVNHVNNGATQPVAVQGFAQNNAVGDACAFYARAATAKVAGSQYCFFGTAGVLRFSCTISNASPAVVTLVAHGLSANREIHFGTTGSLPNGLTASTPTAVTRYWVKTVLSADTFTVSATPGGAAINTSSAGTGTHYVTGNFASLDNPVTINDSMVDYVYTGSGTNSMANIAVQTLDPNSTGKLAGAGIWFIQSGGKWSEGIVFDAASIQNQTIYDLSSSVTSIKIAGSHTYGIDLSGGTFSSNAIYAPRTRRLPLYMFDYTGTANVPSSDGHGSLGGPHWHLADGGTAYILNQLQLVMPKDYVAGTVNVRFEWSSSVANNNVVFQLQVQSMADTVTAVTSLHNANTTIAAPAVANTAKVSTIAINTNPTADTTLILFLGRIGADAGDTNTGQVSVYSVWLEYTADM